MLVDECMCTYYDKYYGKKKETGSSVRDGLLSYTEMLAKASSSRSHLIRDLKERK